MFTWGKNVIKLQQSIALVYYYFGFCYLGFSWGAHIYQVDAEDRVTGEFTEAGLREMGIDSPNSKIPLNDRFGWIVWVIVILICIFSQGAAT